MKLLTNNGKRRIKQYLAGFVPNIGTSIAFGIGNAATSTTTTAMDYEIGRVNVNLTTYDFINNKLIFKATLPSEMECEIHEVGLYSASPTFAGEMIDSRLLTSFVPGVEPWVYSSGENVLATTGTTSRFGDESLRLTAAAGTTTTINFSFPSEDLSMFSGAYKFALALNAGANVSNIVVRFHTTDSSHFTFSTGAVAAGYRFIKVNKAALATTGTPSWSDINKYTISVVAAAGGEATVDLDALKIQKTNAETENNILVARNTLSTAFKKEAGQPHDIEFALSVNV